MKLVKQYLIHYLDALGGKHNASIVAPNFNDAIKRLNIAKHDVVGRSINYKLNSAISINTQLQILTRVSGGIQSGETINQYLPHIIKDFKELKNKESYTNKLISEGKSLSQILTILDLHPLIGQIIASGEKTGNIGNSIKSAKKLLKFEAKIQKSTSATFKGELLKIFTAIILLFAAPWFVVDYYESITSSGVRIDKNFSTSILFFLYDINIYLSIALIVLTSWFVFNKKTILSKFGAVYPLSAFTNISRTKHSILFLSIFKPLQEVDFSTEQFIESYKGVNNNNAKILQQNIAKGTSIAEAIQQLAFSKTFKQSFKGFDRISNKEAKKELINELFFSLSDDLKTFGKQVSKFIQVSADFAIWTLIFILLHGFVVPQLGMGV